MTFEQALTNELHRRGLSSPMRVLVSGHEAYVALVNERRIIYFVLTDLAAGSIDDPELVAQQALEVAEPYTYLCRVRISSNDGIMNRFSVDPRDDTLSQAMRSGNTRITLDDETARRQQYAYEEEDGPFVERFEREAPAEFCRVRGGHDWRDLGGELGKVCRVCEVEG